MPHNRPASASSSNVDLWQVKLADWADLGASCASLLTAGELEQADAFRFDNGRERFILGRGMMRAVLGRMIDAPPREVALHFSGQGKPHLTGDDAVQFNLSHSGEMVMLAVTHGGPIGVDIEAFRELPRRDQIAKGILGAGELSRYEELSDAERQTAFFTIWTRKEAIVKAVGRGLCFPLTDVEVSFSADAHVLRFGECVSDDIPWHLSPIDCPKGYVAALATSRPVTEISIQSWTSDN